jgi:hypothetical protein
VGAEKDSDSTRWQLLSGNLLPERSNMEHWLAVRFSTSTSFSSMV